MSTITEATTASPSRSGQNTIARVVLALVAALALTLGVSAPSFAASGAQTGEWDILASSAAQSPRLQSYNHETETWDTVLSPSASFAVGSGKRIDGDDATATSPVSGGGIRFANTASVTRSAVFTITVPAGTGLSITDVSSGAVKSVPVSTSDQTLTFSTGSVAANTQWHRHYTWEFSGSASSVDLPVSVRVRNVSAGTTAYTASGTYRFTF
ncbi:hypothetical protein NS220_08090 [Microbacterium testaceum]|uniref:Uncharacterized protein n=1 Tax=Microbacterium testaceum TaxID=2033 RepID=A0A147EY02_MICTE|nr:hypothetical protein [Microbacterium testaceum]KTR94741.1 hypothetical protein NS220_08090 [Microbacterium testaceum]